MEILAGITLYNPNADRLLENIKAVLPQVDKLICIDNGSGNIEEIKAEIQRAFPDEYLYESSDKYLKESLKESLNKDLDKDFNEDSNKGSDRDSNKYLGKHCDKFFKIEIIENGENRGIARALNQIFEYAKEQVYDWVLTLDQDSICPENLMEEYKRYIGFKNVGVISPKLVDQNFGEANRAERVIAQTDESEAKMGAQAETTYRAEKDAEEGQVCVIKKRAGTSRMIERRFDYIEKCITSASLTSVETWEKVGGFWEYLFIDFVDHDFCAKCMKNRTSIIRVNSVQLLHELGNGEHHTFLGRRVTALNHSPFRKYYMVRNWLIYMHEHKDVIDYKKERNSYYFFYLKTMLFEDQKLEKLAQMLRGRRDGKAFIKKFL